jgi:hypothetical protein
MEITIFWDVTPCSLVDMYVFIELHDYRRPQSLPQRVHCMNVKKKGILAGFEVHADMPMK